MLQSMTYSRKVMCQFLLLCHYNFNKPFHLSISVQVHSNSQQSSYSKFYHCLLVFQMITPEMCNTNHPERKQSKSKYYQHHIDFCTKWQYYQMKDMYRPRIHQSHLKVCKNLLFQYTHQLHWNKFIDLYLRCSMQFYYHQLM